MQGDGGRGKRQQAQAEADAQAKAAVEAEAEANAKSNGRDKGGHDFLSTFLKVTTDRTELGDEANKPNSTLHMSGNCFSSLVSQSSS